MELKPRAKKIATLIERSKCKFFCIWEASLMPYKEDLFWQQIRNLFILIHTKGPELILNLKLGNLKLII